MKVWDEKGCPSGGVVATQALEGPDGEEQAEAHRRADAAGDQPAGDPGRLIGLRAGAGFRGRRDAPAAGSVPGASPGAGMVPAFAFAPTRNE